MSSAQDVLEVARSQIGYYAPDDPEPGSKYGRWMAELTGEEWLAGPSESIWWCCMFVSWVLDRAGQECPGFPSYNTDLVISDRPPTVPAADMAPGDIVIWDWDGNSATDHIGFVESFSDGRLVTVEGNYHNSVARVDRTSSISLISCVIRPPYGASEPTGRWDCGKGIDIYNGTGSQGFEGDETEAGFVICKASQGVWFRDAYAERFADRVWAAGKLLGFYHYAEGSMPEAEAEFFVQCAKDTGHLAEATLWLDLEQEYDTVPDPQEWAARFMDRVEALTGKVCGFYSYKAFINGHGGFAQCASRPLWGAQYATDEPTYGWVEDPWQSSEGWGAWGGTLMIHQYSGNGRVPGWDGALDLDRGYFTREQWASWAGRHGPQPEPQPEPPDAIDEDGWWGPQTTAALQRRYGTPEDGEVWHQWPSNAQPAFAGGWFYDRTGEGSPLIRAMQADLGCHPDGLIGPNTIKAMQRRCGIVPDGELWGPSPTVREMQRMLNANAW